MGGEEMQRLTKLLIPLVGLLLILLAIFEISQIYVIPGITLWLSELVLAAPELWNSILIVFALVAGATGLSLLIMSVFYASRAKNSTDNRA